MNNQANKISSRKTKCKFCRCIEKTKTILYTIDGESNYHSYFVALVIKGHVAAVVWVRAQSSLVLNLSCAVANVKGDFLVLRPDLVSVAPSTRVAARVVLQKKKSLALE